MQYFSYGILVRFKFRETKRPSNCSEFDWTLYLHNSKNSRYVNVVLFEFHMAGFSMLNVKSFIVRVLICELFS